MWYNCAMGTGEVETCGIGMLSLLWSLRCILGVSTGREPFGCGSSSLRQTGQAASDVASVRCGLLTLLLRHQAGCPDMWTRFSRFQTSDPEHPVVQI